jgi:YHS domain-containing protein
VLWLDDGRSLELDRLERDPLCGMATERGRAIAADVAGEVHYCCSDGCREAFFAGSTHGAVTARA